MRTLAQLLPLALLLAPPAAAQTCTDEVVLQELDAGVPQPWLLTPKGAPVIGGDFAFRLERASPEKLCVLIYSGFQNPLFDPLLGATVWPEFPWFTWFFGTNAQGVSPLVLNTPEITDDLCGADATFQAVVFDDSAPAGVYVSNAVRLRVGIVTEPLFRRDTLASDGTEAASDLAVGDLDGDGLRDLASASGSVAWIRLGLPAGGFAPALKTPLTAAGNEWLTLADVNGDGDLDLVRKVSTGLAFALGDGAGGFTAEVLAGLTNVVAAADLADLDLDGDLDVAVAATDSKDVFVLKAVAPGIFGLPVGWLGTVDPPTGPFLPLGADVAVADLDEDGHPDLVTAMALRPASFPDLTDFLYFHTSVLEGFGDATFGAPVTHVDGTTPVAVNTPKPLHQVALETGDLDGDTHLDVVAVYDDNGTAYRRLGGGDLTLGPVAGFAVGVQPRELALADVDGDSVLDLAVRSSSADVAVLLGTGDGSFAPALGYGVFVNGRGLAVTDEDLDGNADLIVSSGFPGEVEVERLLGNGDGSFRGSQRLRGFGGPLAVGDIDLDRRGDVICRSTVPGLAGLYAFTHAPDGSFVATLIDTGPVNGQLVLVDLNGDTALDIVDDRAGVRLGHGNGAFAPLFYTFGAASGTDVAVGDVDGDLVPDIVSAGGSSTQLNLAFGNGDGTFVVSSTPTPLRPQLVALGDVNGDAKVDIVYSGTHMGVNAIQAVLGNGDGTFGAAVDLVPGLVGNRIRLADLDRDGDLDLLRTTTSRVVRYTNDGSGSFVQAQSLQTNLGQLEDIAVADMDGDGDLDVVVLGADPNGAVLEWGHGTLQAPQLFLAAALPTTTGPLGGVSPSHMAVGDVDRDGIPDVVAVDYSGSVSLTVHLNRLGE